jgi:hypothetical protein
MRQAWSSGAAKLRVVYWESRCEKFRLISGVMTPTEIIRLIKKSGYLFVYQKTIFDCYRQTEDGCTEKLLLEILDAGEDFEKDARFGCIVKGDKQRVLRSGFGPSVEKAILEAHLRKPQRPRKIILPDLNSLQVHIVASGERQHTGSEDEKADKQFNLQDRPPLAAVFPSPTP